MAAEKPEGAPTEIVAAYLHQHETKGLLRFIAQKGSIAVDGTSLTVNAVDDAGFEVMLVPHTLAHTAFGDMPVGMAVNLEVDTVARYVARLQETEGWA